MARQVFISYRKEDKPSADRICEKLERGGIQCWIAPRNIPAGREWAAAIVEALKSCNSFVLVLSSNSKNAKQISREAELADNLGLPIITVRVEDVEPPPELQYFLGNIQWLDAFSDFDSAMQRLTSVVQEERGAPAAAVTPAPAAPPARPSRRNLSPYLIAAAIIVIAAICFGVWWARRTPAPVAKDDAAAASTFGIEYLRARDTGTPQQAYAMTGPAFRKHWTLRKYTDRVEELKKQASALNYAPAGPCQMRQRGAYGCEYLVSSSGGASKKENLIVAGHAPNWVISGDPALASQ